MQENNDLNSSSYQTSNCYLPFISANPITSFNPVQIFPTIDKTALISQFSSVIGDVIIKNNVFVAPNVSIRADEGTPFSIGSSSNIQDGVILHGLRGKRVLMNGKPYSIYIGDQVSIAHGALVHGPCYIGNDVFVGFNALIYNAVIGKGSFISYYAVVTNGVRLAPNRFVPPGAHIDTQEKADALSSVPADSIVFAHEVQRVNREFPPSYHLLFGKQRCSCGLAYNE